ncbi:hypothetical protein AW168_35615 [Nocardia brasiliensis]|nr:hypothetical protein AW168_35615 [Nocardia brasiliensis]
MLWLCVVVFALFVFPGLLGAIATAQGGSTTTPGVNAGNSALSWMDVRDSEGVEMSQYFVAHDDGGFLAPAKFVLATSTDCVMVGWGILTITPIYLIGSVVSFSWMSSFEDPLHDLADSYTRAIVTPPVLLLSGTIGSFFTIYFFVRGFHAKAAYQIMFMTGIAVLAPALLLNPMATIFSSDGPLVMGRDFGLAVASGLNGEVGTDPDKLVARMQTHMADNFGRKPLQTWNFGHVVDQRPACRVAWSKGIESGDSEQVRQGMETCQDLVARNAIDNPTWGQLGTGIVMGGSSMFFLLFALYIGYKVIRAVFDVVFNLFMMILGLATLGFIHGPPQVSLISSGVGIAISSAEMSLFTMLLGVYMFLNGSLFSSPDDHMQMLVLGALLHLVFIVRARKIAKAMRSAEHWVSNRFAQKLQDVGGKGKGGGGGGGGAAALGMGKSEDSSTTLKTLAGLSMLAAISGSPLTGRLFRMAGNPFSFDSRGTEAIRRGQRLAWTSIAPEYTDSYRSFAQLTDISGAAIKDPLRFRGSGVPPGLRTIGDMSRDSVIGFGDRRHTLRGIAHVVNSLDQESGYGFDRALSSVLVMSDDPRVNARMIAAFRRTHAMQEDNLARFKPLSEFRAAVDQYVERPDAVHMSVLEQKGLNLVRAYSPQSLPGELRTHVDNYMAAPNRKELESLWKAGEGAPLGISRVTLGGASVDLTGEEAWQAMNYIGYERSLQCLNPLNTILESSSLDSPAAQAAVRDLRRYTAFAEAEDMWPAGINRSPANPSAG